MTKNQLAAQLRSGLFGSRETLEEAYEYASVIAQASDNPAAVFTALHVMMNTIAKQLETA